MKYLVTCIRTDLDKLTKKDLNHFLDEMNNWYRKRDGKPVSEATKKQYKVGIVRFLRHWGRESDNRNLIELFNNFDFGKTKSKRKLPEDLLTKEDIDKMIAVAELPRDKALVAILYESGARRGELVNCRVKDVRPNPNGFHIRLDGKTGARQVLVHFYQSYLKDWINAHPIKDDPNAPLFGKFEDQKYIALDGAAIYYLVTKIARTAGIKGRCHPHLFRHSIATNMAKTLTENQLKARFGWDQSSNMTAVYVHLSGKDVDDALLESYGIIETKKDDGTKVNVCVRCRDQVSRGIKYCPTCGEPLIEEEKQTNNVAITEMISLLQQNPQILAEALAKVRN